MACPAEGPASDEEGAGAEPISEGTRCKVRTCTGRHRWVSVVEVGEETLTVAYEGYPPEFNEQIPATDSGRILEVARLGPSATYSSLVEELARTYHPESPWDRWFRFPNFNFCRPVGTKEKLDWLMVAVMLVATVALSAGSIVPLQVCEGFFDDFFGYYYPAWLNRLRLVAALAMTTLAAPLVGLLLVSAPSHYLHSVAVYATLVWVTTYSAAAYDSYACRIQTDTKGAHIFLLLGGVTLVVALSQLLRLLLMNLNRLEKSLLWPVGVRQVRRLLAVLVALLVTVAALGAASTLVEDAYYVRRAMGALTWASLALMVCYVALNIRALRLARNLARAVELASGGRVRAEARAATRSATNQLLGGSFCVATTVWMLVGILLTAPKGYAWPAAVGTERGPWFYLLFSLVPGWTDTVANLVGATALFQGAFRGGIKARRGEAQRKRKRAELARKYKSAAGGDAAWEQQVRRLADRGFSLRELLRFYRGLGSEYMKHFTPAVHTTEDVVRQAIIPMSSHRKCAYSEIMMDHAPTRPNKMVTHNWQNLFRDLVAGIVADALGEDEYKMVVALLDVDIGQLESWLAAAGKLGATYWVCALSVSQHASICGANPLGTRDPVTGAAHPACGCGAEKFLNDTPPCTADGRSIPCEMNKFDEMMRYLAATDQAFEQVIVVDVGFVLFSRAWCIAEIVEAHNMGIGRHLKLESLESLNMHMDDLRDLRVENMHATRREDIDDILDKIPDRGAFNRSLQRLIFGNILPKWQSLDAKEKMAQVGRLGRWGSLRGSVARAVFSP